MITIDKSNWRKVKISDIFEKKEENDKVNAQNRFDRFLKVEHIDAESLRIKRWSSQEAGDEINPTFYKIFRAGQVLFPTRNPHLRRTALADFDGICGEKTLTLEPKKELVDEQFIPFLFHSESFYSHSTSVIIGSTNPHCRWRDIANYEFLLPPKDLQTKLAELLWAVDKVIESDSMVLKKLEVTREILFQTIVNESEGVLKKFSDLLIPKKEKSTVPHKRDRYVGLEHLDSGAFECLRYGDASEAESSCNIVNIGDLCYSKLRPYLDKAFIASFDAISTTEILVYGVKEISAEYALHHLHSKPFIAYASGKGFGTKMPRVSNEIVGQYHVKVLKNESELLSKMKSIKESESKLNSKITASKALQKSLINEVF